MAKKTAEVSIEEQVEQILDAAKTDVLALLADRAEPAAPEGDEDEKPAKKGKKEAEEPAAEETAELPDLETIQEMSKEELSELAGKLNIEVEGRKTSETRALLETVHHVVADNTDELEEDAVNALAEAVSIEPAKKLAATIEKLQEYFEKDSDGDGSEGEDKDEAKDKDADEDAPAHPKCVLKAKLPDEDEMKERLEAHNEAQEDDDKKIEFDADEPDEVSAAYRNLLALCVDDDGALAEWGAVYVKDEAACCCGLPCEDTEIKGDDREFAKCLVTGKLFFQGDDGALEEFVPKKKLGSKK